MTVRLPAPGRIAGRVRGTAGAWTVRLRGAPEPIVERYEGPAQFEMAPVAVPGSYDVEVIAADGSSATARVDLSDAAPEAELDLVLVPPRLVRGRVVGPDGTPRPGATVGDAVTTADGRFEVAVPAGRRTVLVWDRPGGGLPHRVPLPPGTGDVDLGDVPAAPDRGAGTATP